jgi:hypothetical protein
MSEATRTSGTPQEELMEPTRRPSTFELPMNPTDHIQIVTFQLAGIEPDADRAHVEASAPAFTEIPGLRAKAWLANPSTNTYGGEYAWESRHAMKTYINGPIFDALLTNPGLAESRRSGLRIPRTAVSAAAQTFGSAGTDLRSTPLAVRFLW